MNYFIGLNETKMLADPETNFHHSKYFVSMIGNSRQYSLPWIIKHSLACLSASNDFTVSL